MQHGVDIAKLGMGVFQWLGETEPMRPRLTRLRLTVMGKKIRRYVRETRR